MYYRITCEDNGVGMQHAHIPEMLGRVLSGSKYGVRQTRGKFGLGAKMALIWSKKSTGLPIDVRSAHSTDADTAPASVSHIVLDIDIHRNEPQVEVDERLDNVDGWRGTCISLCVAGNWSTYKGRILDYFKQLAIITPYANLALEFQSSHDTKRNCSLTFTRRSDSLPPVPRTVKHHPSSLNHLLLNQLLQDSKAKTLVRFLSTDLAGTDRALATRIISTLGGDFSEDMGTQLTTKQISHLAQTLRDVQLFAPPDATCLSPAGEYNLRLGVMKELSPEFVATASEKPSSIEGHPFLVEVAVCVGGAQSREGITVYRFANRIPLLFEAGADVATQVAQKAINWSSYKINPSKDKIGVFVSIVSTKIPFKGTGKEYIGDDIQEIHHCVKRGIQSCCLQLRSHLTRRNALEERRQRKRNLTKYVPDVTRALVGVLRRMHEDAEGSEDTRGSSLPSSASSGSGLEPAPSFLTPVAKRVRTSLLQDVARGVMSEESLAAQLTTVVEEDERATENLAAEKQQARHEEPFYIKPLRWDDQDPPSQGFSVTTVGGASLWLPAGVLSQPS